MKPVSLPMRNFFTFVAPLVAPAARWASCDARDGAGLPAAPHFGILGLR
jgi:hypothetical protein